MSILTLTIACVALVGYSLMARRLSRFLVTGPMAFLIIGVCAFLVIDPLEVESSAVHILAELTLVLILFHDASTVRLRTLRHDAGPPLRLLLIGFPLAVLLTFATSSWLLPTVGLYGALLIAAAISPTDAGLGAPTVLNPRIPVRIRRALNVESGLNDGLATPVVLFALTWIASQAGDAVPTLIEFAAKPLLIGLAVGILCALVIAKLIDLARGRGYSSRQAAEVVILLTPLLTFLVADLFHANAFIAAFVGGLVFGSTCKTLEDNPDESNLTDSISEIASGVVWFLAGGLLIEVFDLGIEWQSIVLALLALTILRVVPVVIALLGTGFRLPTVAFIGWFGPRGLATVVFALLTVEELGTTNTVVEPIISTLAVAIVLSVFAHGISSSPLARRYSEWCERRQPEAELAEAPEPRSRRSPWQRQDTETVH